MVPLDHSLTSGPMAEPIDTLIGQIASGGADAVVLHKGSLRQVTPARFASTALILHLSGGTDLAPDPDARCLVATVEEAVTCGADAVSVHVNLGSAGEARQLADLAQVATACDRWGMPLLAMVYPRGPRIANPRDPDLVAHAVAVAADLGAHLVKTVNPGSTEVLAQIARRSPIPVLVAGGAFDPDEGATLARVHEAMRGGVAGVAMGRAIFQSADPAAMTRKVAEVVHGHFEVDRRTELRQGEAR